MQHRTRSKPRAFMLADTMLGLMIVVALAIIAAKAAGWQRKADRQMNDLRAATDLAESTLIDLHQGVAPPAAANDQRFRIEPVTGGATIPGYSWCRVVATVHGRSASLIGLRANEKGG